MIIRTTFKQISNQLTKLWNPSHYYYAKQQEVCKEKFKLLETTNSKKFLTDPTFRYSTKLQLEILDKKIDVLSNKWNETKTHISSKQQKKLTTQQDILRSLDWEFKTLNNWNSLSPLNDTKKKNISKYLSGVSESITQHINLINKQLSLEKRQINQYIDNPVSSITKNEQTMPKDIQQKNKGLDSPKTKKRFKDIVINETAVYNEAFKKLETVQMFKNIKISSAEKCR
ncbi:MULTISPECIES: hypothetical protein [unclassified Enterococcus]|jgi:hypothetical protein|uniref:hypothetical protein n=1 Tax=unclassified Enterococcus TaxID=2608891 RepID=UPI003D2ADF60